MLQQGLSQEHRQGLKAWFQEPWHMASHPFPSLLTPTPLGSLLRLKPTETFPLTNSPPPAEASTFRHLWKLTPTSQHQAQPNPPVHQQHQFDLTWIYTVLFLRSHNQPRSDLSTAVSYPTPQPVLPTPSRTHTSLPSLSSSHPPHFIPSPLQPPTSAITVFSRIQ